MINIFEKSTGPSDWVELSLNNSNCKIYLFGASVYSWTINKEEKLWISSLSCNDGSCPIRGGIPIAFPQFANQGPLMLHGFARESLWKVCTSGTENNSVYVTFELNDNESTRKIWNYKFRLLYKVVLTPNSLKLGMFIENCDAAAWSFTHCLHTYFRTENILNMILTGLKGTKYVDKVDNMNVYEEKNDCLVINDDSMSNEQYYVDRIYKCSEGDEVSEAVTKCIFSSDDLGDVSRVLGINDESLNMMYRRVVLADNNSKQCVFQIDISNSFPDTVIFNPWKEGKKGSKGPDFDDDGYNYMLCIEPAVASAEIQLASQRSSSGHSKWVGQKIITVL